MIVKVLGKGCARCLKLEALARDVAAELGLPATVEHVYDLEGIAKYPVLATPALVVDEVVKASGRVPSKGELGLWMREAAARA